ncbi:hypothetical protein [Mesobacterium pallidum]|uniref:hypothetical protein n=1 Tax=Mesobacterium pallidum TaxID=2872037 RepID=UPI001EE29CC9|nr:hypothetical protein [Mesobacterium pallidum]
MSRAAHIAAAPGGMCEPFPAIHRTGWTDETEACAGLRLIREACFEDPKTFNTVKELT